MAGFRGFEPLGLVPLKTLASSMKQSSVLQTPLQPVDTARQPVITNSIMLLPSKENAIRYLPIRFVSTENDSPITSKNAIA